MKVLGIVHVPRHTGGGDPMIRRKLAGKSLLELVVRRVSDCQRLDRVIVVAGDPDWDPAVRRLVPPDVETFAGRQNDALARFVASAEQWQADAIVRVCAHAPFVDPVLIDRLVIAAAEHESCDYLGYCRADGRPALYSQVAIAAEWCSVQALRQSHRDATRPADRDHPTACVLGHPETFRVRLMALPAGLDRDDLRLRVDSEEDWDHAHEILEALAPEDWDWQRLANLLDRRPARRKPVAALKRSTAA